MSTATSPSTLTGRYHIEAVIGRGGAGEVFAAWDTQLQRNVAIKKLRTDADDVSVKSLWMEATRLAAVGHPNIVSIYDMGVEEGLPYIVMERLDGETVDKRVARGLMGLEEFSTFAQQSLEALIAAHHAGMIHRDLKPSNLMLSKLPSGSLKVKVLDFGIAKFLTSPSEQTMNIDGTITGSIHCIAPEQLNRDPVDHRSDLYSLGCVFYYALAGAYPFGGGRFSDIISAHLNHQVDDLRRRRADLPPLLCDWCMGLINRLPEHRYQSATEALAALRHVLPQLPTGPIALTLPQAPASHDPAAAAAAPRQTSRLPFAAAAVLLVTVAGAVAWFFAREKDSLASAPAPEQIAHIISTTQREPDVVTPPAVPGDEETFVAKSTAVPEPDPAPAPTIPALPPTVAPSLPATAALETATVPRPAAAELSLRVSGSNTIGATLLPALLERFLEREGATEIVRLPGKSPEEALLQARMPGKNDLRSFEIEAHGSSTAFSELFNGRADLGMSSRSVKPEEVETGERSGLGQLDAPASEYVLGLDGLAIVVHRKNPVGELTKAQVSKIFSGQITDWAEVGGRPGAISIYARDEKSGTYDTFKSLVLGKSELVGNARRFEDSNALADSVGTDEGGIGFIGLPYVRNTKLLAISEDGTAPLLATRFTVATEDYVLSRRLYLYTPARSRNPLVSKFVEFALSPEGQEIVHKVGFVKQTIDLERPILPSGAPADYLTTIKGAERLSLNFRFRAGQTELDNKALRDLDRIAAMTTEPRFQRRKLALLGFADGKGTASINLKLSRERAHIVAEELARRGISAQVVIGFGSALPVASNDSEVGRDKNRRVEVWLGPASDTVRN